MSAPVTHKLSWGSWQHWSRAIIARCNMMRMFDQSPAGDRPARSYSQQHTWLECPRRFQLEKVVKVPRKPGWWLPGGTAVHSTIELYLLSTLKEDK